MTSARLRSFLAWTVAVVAFAGGWMTLYTLGATLSARGTAVDEAGGSGYWVASDTWVMAGGILLLLFAVGLGAYLVVKRFNQNVLEDVGD